MESNTKGLLQSQTNLWITALTLLAVYLPEIQAYLVGIVPEPWNALVVPICSLVAVILGLLGIRARVGAKKAIEGVWKRKPK